MIFREETHLCLLCLTAPGTRLLEQEIQENLSWDVRVACVLLRQTSHSLKHRGAYSHPARGLSLGHANNVYIPRYGSLL